MVTDVEFARAFEQGAVRNEDFRHRQHLRLAWVYLLEGETPAAAATRMCDTLRTFAASVGHAEKYHETLTIFWMRLLAAVRDGLDLPRAFEDVVATHSYLLDKDLPLAYYSRARLSSAEARLEWVPPDLRPLCSDDTHTDPRNPPGDAPDRPLSGGAERVRPGAG